MTEKLLCFKGALLYPECWARSAYRSTKWRVGRVLHFIIKTFLHFVVTLGFFIPAATLFAQQTLPLGLPTLTANVGSNVRTGQVIQLGRRLFFDKNLSADGSVSCADCHQPAKAFSDGRRLAQGIHGLTGTRNTPSLFNAAYLQSLFWDGRRTTLEEQVLDPFINPIEHGLSNHQELISRIRRDKDYRDAFSTAYKLSPDDTGKKYVARAIAAYVRTLLAGDSPFDRYLYGGDRQALTPDAVLGLELFRGRARCVECHIVGEKDALFSDGKFHSLGIGFGRIQARLPEFAARVVAQTQPLGHTVLRDPELAELGRFLVTHDPHDIGKFKTPSLRNVALTAPYMHDGSVATLEAAIDRETYYRGLTANRPVVITAKEKAELIEFLRSLTSTNAGKVD